MKSKTKFSHHTKNYGMRIISSHRTVEFIVQGIEGTESRRKITLRVSGMEGIEELSLSTGERYKIAPGLIIGIPRKGGTSRWATFYYSGKLDNYTFEPIKSES